MNRSQQERYWKEHEEAYEQTQLLEARRRQLGPILKLINECIKILKKPTTKQGTDLALSYLQRVVPMLNSLRIPEEPEDEDDDGEDGDE
jgi:hypothetical protein